MGRGLSSGRGPRGGRGLSGTWPDWWAWPRGHVTALDQSGSKQQSQPFYTTVHSQNVNLCLIGLGLIGLYAVSSHYSTGAISAH